jgi:hypothetical protein
MHSSPHSKSLSLGFILFYGIVVTCRCQAEFVLERAAMDIFNEIKERKHVAAKNASVKRFPAIVRKQGHAAPASALQTEVALSSDEIDIYAKTSIIQAAGGMSGLGFEQFSDNDRFSAIVKFLLNFNQFKEVKIWSDLCICWFVKLFYTSRWLRGCMKICNTARQGCIRVYLFVL